MHWFWTVSLIHQEFFENPAFRADGLKIYPTLVIRGTGERHCSFHCSVVVVVYNSLWCLCAWLLLNSCVTYIYICAWCLCTRFVWVMEDRKVQELSSQCFGWSCSQDTCSGASLDQSVQSSKVPFCVLVDCNLSEVIVNMHAVCWSRLQYIRSSLSFTWCEHYSLSGRCINL